MWPYKWNLFALTSSQSFDSGTVNVHILDPQDEEEEEEEDEVEVDVEKKKNCVLSFLLSMIRPQLSTWTED